MRGRPRARVSGGTSLEQGLVRTLSRSPAVQPALPRALSLLSLIVAAPAWAQEPPAESLIGPPVAGGLTADEVARHSVDTSREVRARAEERAAADATVRQAQSGYVPRLSGV